MACVVKFLRFVVGSASFPDRPEFRLGRNSLEWRPGPTSARYQDRTHEILAILSYWEGVSTCRWEKMAEVRYDVAMSLSKGCGGAAGR